MTDFYGLDKAKNTIDKMEFLLYTGTTVWMV